MNKRNGKIARLPKDLRELVNRMLDDGAQYRSIMNELEKHRHRWPDDIKEFTDGNFTEWHQGGYQDWVREQELQHDLSARREYAHAIGESTPSGNVSEAVHEIGTLHLYHFLTSIDRAALETKIRDDPAACARLVNAFARLSTRSNQFQRYKDHVRRCKDRLTAELARAKAGTLTADTINALENELNHL